MNKIIFIDTETGGVNPEKAALIQLSGIIRIDKKDVEKLKILYRAIPIENKYTDIIAKILDILIDNKIDIQDISEYLQRVNKIKSYSRGFLSNSEEILQEKEFFKDLRERVKDCALKNEIDDILSSLAYTIKMEIEHDKERFFD